MPRSVPFWQLKGAGVRGGPGRFEAGSVTGLIEGGSVAGPGGPEPRGSPANASPNARDPLTGAGPGGAARPARTWTAGLAQDFLAATELPEELLHRARQGRVVEAVDDVLALALVDHQVRLLEHRQVARDRGLRQVEVADDLAD